MQKKYLYISYEWETVGSLVLNLLACVKPVLPLIVQTVG